MFKAKTPVLAHMRIPRKGTKGLNYYLSKSLLFCFLFTPRFVISYHQKDEYIWIYIYFFFLISDSVLSCAFHPTKPNVVVTGGMDEKFFVWDASSGDAVMLLEASSKVLLYCLLGWITRQSGHNITDVGQSRKVLAESRIPETVKRAELLLQPSRSVIAWLEGGRPTYRTLNCRGSLSVR